MASNTTLCAKQINTNKSNLNSLKLGVETLTAAGAISTTIPVTILSKSDGNAAMTLADGNHTGQLKIVICGSEHDHSITPTTTAGAYASVTFDDAGGASIGSTVTFMWINGTGWAILSRVSGDGDTAAATVKSLPVVATV